VSPTKTTAAQAKLKKWRRKRAGQDLRTAAICALNALESANEILEWPDINRAVSGLSDALWEVKE
jgi:hypothetical protein